jgi:putative ABC transport system substrate-binding protein
MREIIQRLFRSHSDNRKSKIKNRKLVGLSLIAFVLVVAVAVVEAQQRKNLPRIGLLIGSSASSNAARIEAFQQGLRELGYVEGQNVFVEYRYSGGKADEYPKLAAELVSLKVDLIVAGGGSSLARAVKQTTKMIPIVITGGSDPVGAGLVASLAQQVETSQG